MKNRMLMRDLKLDILLDAMAGGSETLRKVCKKRLWNGLQSVEEIAVFQKVLKDMLQDDRRTKAIFEITCETGADIMPYKNSLAPQQVSALSPMDKFRTHLNICIIISRGLSRIYGMQEETAEKEKTDRIINELEGLLGYGRDLCFSLSGRMGPGLHIGAFEIRKIASQESRSSILRFRKKSSRSVCDGETYRNMEGDAMQFRNAACYSLLKILTAYANDAEARLLDIREQYGIAAGASNLLRILEEKEIPVSWPHFSTETATFSAANLTELSLGLKKRQTRGNSVELNGMQICFITGANQGGKTTYLRSVGQAQMMAQAGLFVAAEHFETEYHDGIFTHFPDEENLSGKGGLLEREVSKLKYLIREMSADSMLLMNESFQTTTEGDGYEIGKAVVEGVYMTNVKLFFVTHNYLLVRNMRNKQGMVFLKAEVGIRGERTYQIQEGVPERSAHARQLYDSIL